MPKDPIPSGYYDAHREEYEPPPETEDERFLREYKEYRQRKKKRKLQRDIGFEDIEDEYRRFKQRKKYDKYGREKKYYPQEQQIAELKAEKRSYEQERNIRGYRKDIRRERFRAKRPGISRVGRATAAGIGGLQKISTRADRGIQRQGKRTLRDIASQFITTGRRQVFPPSAGLGERAVMEASSGWIPHLDRQYFNEEQEQRDLLGEASRDMNLLVETPESIQRKRNQQYY